MDELSIEVIQKIYTPEMVKQWLAAGWGPITYRNHTELAIEAWHWNSKGTWSDSATSTGLLCRRRGAFGAHSRFFRLPVAASRHDVRWGRRERLREAHRWRCGYVLEEQPVPYQVVYRRR